MPIYEYGCTKCGVVEEVIQKVSDKPLRKCMHCSGKVQKLISQSTFHLKGSGWYVTDYAKQSGSKPETHAKKPDSDSAGKTETKKSASKNAD